MSLWLLIALFGLIKLPIAAMMLLLPFRNDEAMNASEGESSTDEDGGSLTPPHEPPRPRPRWPASPRPREAKHGRSPARAIAGPRRRGAHGAPPPHPPRRVRPSRPARPLPR
jgi:hypothetical protein